MKIVIRAGGTGTRLWPMSRINNPKQFQKIVGDKSMIRTTYERISPLLKNPDDLFISINQNFVAKLKEEVPEINEKNIIAEPDMRNTGPAMCLEVCYLEKFCSPDEVIASLPADDYISNAKAFRDLLSMTEEFINEHHDYILTPAIKPDYPDTGYTYFKAGKNLEKSGKEAIFEVAQVVEKPNDEYCQDLIKSGVYYCHTGMYLWKLELISNLFKKFQPTMYEVCQETVKLILDGSKQNRKKTCLFSQLEKITIETAITEKCDKIAMSVSNRTGWSDLGKWHVIKRMLVKKEDSNLIQGEVVTNDAYNNLIYSTVDKKIVVANDIEGLVVVDTKDALFISSLKNSQEVKKMVDRLKQEGKEEYL